MDDYTIKFTAIVCSFVISVIGACFAGSRLSRCTLIKCGHCEVHRDLGSINNSAQV